MNEITTSNVSVVPKTSPKDFFLHLLSILTLYYSAGSFLALIFKFINIYFPDALTGDYSPWYSYSAIRWSLASLIIIFPVYLGVSWFLEKSYRVMPEKRNVRIRKWLIYFTLFVAALIMIGDLVTLLYSLLGGEITMRFILKVVAVFFVSGSIFWYYLSDLRAHKTE